MSTRITPPGELAEVQPPYTVAYVLSPRALEAFALDVALGRVPDLWDYIAHRISTEGVDTSAAGETVITRVVQPDLVPDRSALN